MTMVIMLVLALAALGVAADFLIENHLVDAQSHSFALFGTTIHMSEPVAALAAFGLGAFTIVCLVAAASRRRRHVGRRQLKKRVVQLEHENDELRTRDQVFSTSDKRKAG